MTKTTKTILALAILAASGTAAAAKPLPVANYMGIENREGLVAIPVCAKADLAAGTRYIWSKDPAVRTALQAGAELGCYERLGPEGDLGYAQAGVSLIREGGSVYRVTVNGKPAGQALRALATPKSGIAVAAKPLPVANYMAIENRDGLTSIPVCAKAELPAGTKYIWTESQALRAALQAGAQKGCYERLGREGDMGYAQAGVSLVREGGNVYRGAIEGQPAGQALRTLTTAK